MDSVHFHHSLTYPSNHIAMEIKSETDPHTCTTLTTPVVDMFISIINKILINKRDIGSEIFKLPVPYVELGLIDYVDVVKMPMDLTTVKTKLEKTAQCIQNNASMSKKDSDCYKSPEDCISDMRQIWYNAMVYNTSESEVYAAAKELSIYYEQELKHLYQNEALFNNKDSCPPPNTNQVVHWNNACRKYVLLRQCVPVLLSLNLCVLCKSCRLLPEHMGVVVDILIKNCPACVVKVVYCSTLYRKYIIKSLRLNTLCIKSCL